MDRWTQQVVAMVEALERLQDRFNEVAEAFRDQESRLEALESWRAEVDRRLAS